MRSHYKYLRTLEGGATVRAAAGACAAEGLSVLSLVIVKETVVGWIARVILLTGRVRWLVAGPGILPWDFATLGAARRFLRSIGGAA